MNNREQNPTQKGNPHRKRTEQGIEKGEVPPAKQTRREDKRGTSAAANKALDLLYKEKGARSRPHQRNKACKACELGPAAQALRDSGRSCFANVNSRENSQRRSLWISIKENGAGGGAPGSIWRKLNKTADS